MASSECCRLCKGDVETVVSVFDTRINENLPAIVQVTTGVEITPRDEVSQKLCLTCLQITIKMYKFRKTALKNNEELMTKHAQRRPVVDPNKSASSDGENINRKNSQQKSSFRLQPKYKNAHPSIKNMLEKNPGVVLPRFPLNSHVQPYITLDHDEVGDYYTEQGISLKEIEDQKKSAIKAAILFEELRPHTKRAHDSNSDEQNSKRKCLAQVVPETKKLSKNVTLVRVNPSSVIAKGAQTTKNLPNGLTKESLSNESLKNGSISRLVDPQFGKPNMIGPKSKVVAPKPNVFGPPFSKPNAIAKKKTLPSKPILPNASKSLKGSFPQPPVLHKDKCNDNNKTQEGSAASDRMPRLYSILHPSSTTEPRVNHVDTDHAYAHNDDEIKRYKLRLQRNIIYDDEEQSDSSSTVDATFAQENDEVSSESSATSRSTISLLDSSLVSHSHKKPRTLFSCKVCDCVLYSKKDLQNHLQRLHTKCPFCSHRFRTTAARDEHVANDCTAKEVNQEPIKLKNAKLELVKVDEIKEIRDKYPSAFETPKITDEQDATSTENDAINTTDVSENASIDVPTAVRSDVICISDEETDKNTTTATASKKDGAARPKAKPNISLSLIVDSKPKINIVNSNILEKINMQDSDSSILRLILKDVTKSIEKPQIKPPPNIELPKNSSIQEGDTSRIQILRNLRSHLSLYRIPVDINYGEKLKLEYNYNKMTGIKQKRDFWYNLPPKDIKKVTKQPNVPPPAATNNTVPAPPTPIRPSIGVKANTQQAVVQGMLQNNSNVQGVRNGNEASGTKAVYTIHNVSQHNTLQSPGNIFLTVQAPMNSSSVQNASTSSSSSNVVLNVVPTMNHLPVSQSSNVSNRGPLILNATPQKHVVTQYRPNETNFVIASIQGGVPASIQGGVPAQNTAPTPMMTPTSNNIFLVTPTATTTTSAPAASNAGPTYIVVNKNVSKLNSPAQTRAQVYNPMSSAILTPISAARPKDTFTIVQSAANSSTAVSEVPSPAPSSVTPVIRVKNLRELS